jgi:sec-independent protein translocase protein TatA
MIGYPELIIILAVVLLLFGANKLPEIARSIGKSTKEFKKAQSEVDDEPNSSVDNEEKVRKLAAEMGIDVNGKTIEQITDEMRAKVRLRVDKK